MLQCLVKSGAWPPKRCRVTSASTPSSGKTRYQSLVTLAVESSCDDTSVAVAELHAAMDPSSPQLTVHFHESVTANNSAYNGIHPLVALQSHQTCLAPLVERALRASPRPHLIAATRGPGMRSNLAVGLDTAKGLSLGLGVPFLGIHHMQAHALTPRLVAAMQNKHHEQIRPRFPFLTVLASGGHTMLLESKDLLEHHILAETHDIALGDCLDKAARAILPQEALYAPYGRALEQFAFPCGDQDYQYTPPIRRMDELVKQQTRWNWGFRPPFAESTGGLKTSRRMAYSFAGLSTSAERYMARSTAPDGSSLHLVRETTTIPIEERREMAREIQRVAFEHVASRILLHLSSTNSLNVDTVVVSGGVASNAFFRHVMRAFLDVRGHERIALEFPPPALCTDNALMIAWAAFEMWNAGWRSTIDILPIRKWSMESGVPGGGILNAGGYLKIAGA